MRNLFENDYLLLAARIIVAMVFIFASIEKIADPESFAVAVSNYRVLPVFLINFVAIAIPWIELFAGIFLLAGVFPRENSLIIGALLVMFIVLISIALIRGLDIECGCYGTINAEKVGFKKIAENFLLLTLSLQIILYGAGKFIIGKKI